MSPPKTTRLALVAALASFVLPAALAQQTACGLEGYYFCERDGPAHPPGDFGCCPTGYECHATQCSPTATTPPPAPATTACPGVPAHFLCPEAAGGNCCYHAFACDPANPGECVLTSTERVFISPETITGTDGSVTTISTSIFYPWPKTTTRETPTPGPSSSSPSGVPTKSDNGTTKAPTTSPVPTSKPAPLPTAGANQQKMVAGGAVAVLGGIMAGLLI